MILVEYNSSNSGGKWWLKDEDWDKLAANGWELQPLYSATDPDGRFLGAKATGARKRFLSVGCAKAEFEALLGQDPDAQGCRCCGAPHDFDAIAEVTT